MNLTSLISPGWKGFGVALAIGAVIGALISWWATDKAKSVEIASLNTSIAILQRQHIEDLKAISDKSLELATLNAQKEHQFASDVAKSDQKNTQELNHALSENAALRDDVATGAKRLQLAKADLATCRLTAGATGRAAGMVNGAAISFSDDFGRNVYDIRAGIISDQQKLKQLQDYVRAGQSAGLIAK
ncbi:lysis protein [Pantoea dispersa]|uniref:lysis system i-spanin subunit Rz n=1 Tax=Pantoea dispersa TaxID=59814 RepID=UPI000F67AC88|nr:lysis system i-spanin subunit Rz [Pantoea dispersa]RRW77626.1 lysis protein [Pantoea dispersa]